MDEYSFFTTVSKDDLINDKVLEEMSNEVEKDNMDDIHFSDCKFNLDSIDFSDFDLEDDITKFPSFKNVMHSEIHFEVCILFDSLDEFKRAISKYSTYHGEDDLFSIRI